MSNVDINYLQPGMVVESVDRGSVYFVIGVDKDGANEFFKAPNITFFDIRDPELGPCSTSSIEEYRLIEGDERRKVLEKILDGIIDHSSHVKNWISMVRIALYGDKA